jgi:hypothetical protein
LRYLVNEVERGEQPHRGANDEETEEGRFSKNYRSYAIEKTIELESLPQYTLKKVVYTSRKPAFVLAWLQDHLNSLLKEKEVFMKDFGG